MDNNTGNGINGRRSASRATKLRRRRKRMNFLLMAVFALIVAVIVIVSPKEPLRRARRTIATEDENVSANGERLVDEYEGLVISEIMSANHSAVTDENGAYPDWVEIWNSSAKDISLYGLGLSDSSDRIRFLFPDVVLPADGRVIVFCSNTNQAVPGQPYHAKFKLSSIGESVYLYDPNAYLIDSCTYPILGTDESWSLTDEGFQAVSWFSPGFENTPEGHQKYRESVMTTGGALVINEVMADAITGLRDEDGELSDWVEIYNTTDAAVSLENYALSDNEGRPLKWRFPKGAVVPAHGYYVVFCSGKDKVEAASGVPHTNFRISAEQETIILSDSRGHVVDRVMIEHEGKDFEKKINKNNYLVYNLFDKHVKVSPDIRSSYQVIKSNLIIAGFFRYNNYFFNLNQEKEINEDDELKLGIISLNFTNDVNFGIYFDKKGINYNFNKKDILYNYIKNKLINPKNKNITLSLKHNEFLFIYFYFDN